MIIYVITSYLDGVPSNDFYTSRKTCLIEEIGESIWNHFDESFDVIGYEIPEEIENKYKSKKVDNIFKDYIDANNESIGDWIVFEQRFDKKHLLCTNRDDDGGDWVEKGEAAIQRDWLLPDEEYKEEVLF